jgi:hypothetical protein
MPASRSAMPLLVAGAGVVIAIGGTVAHFVSDTKYATLKQDCGGSVQCSQARYTSDSGDVRTFDALSITGWAIGGAALLGGGLWYFLSPPSPRQNVGFHVSVNPVTRDARLAGTFW